MKRVSQNILDHLAFSHARALSRQTTAARMSKQNLASADDFEEHVQSTSIPGKQSTKRFPQSAKPNACKLIPLYRPSKI